MLKDLIIFYIYYGSYKYKILPFRLINRPATYQWYINNILFNYFNEFYTAYLNNILIYLDNKLKYKVYIKKGLKNYRT